MSVPRRLRPSLHALLTSCAVLLLLAGCGGAADVVGSATPGGVSPAGPARTTSSGAPSSAATAATSSAAPSPAPTSVRPGPDGFLSFTTPSRNIACYVSSGDGQSAGEARCDITEADWHAAPEPDSCSGSWGRTLTVGRGRAGFGCVSDSAVNDDVVAYGTRQTRGDFTCDVEQTGVTCSDLATGHGFSVSRATYRFF